MDVKRLARLAMLTAAALIIFIVELQIPNPFPIPGIKLGLANIITVYAVYRYRAAEVAMLVAVRITLGSVFSGNVMALLYSACGSLFCLAGMLLDSAAVAGKILTIFLPRTAEIFYIRRIDKMFQMEYTVLEDSNGAAGDTRSAFIFRMNQERLKCLRYPKCLAAMCSMTKKCRKDCQNPPTRH